MSVIKRYPNRKLYDTEAKSYVTLEGIADLIRSGVEVHVIDHASGEDLTALTLSQIIFEQEKKQSGFLPRAVLASLIQEGGSRLSALQRTLASSIGFWNQVDEEIRRRVQALISAGQLTEGEGHKLLEKLISEGMHLQEERQTSHQESHISPDQIEQYLARHQVPTRSDLQRLMDQVDTLFAKLEDYSSLEDDPKL